MKFKCWLAAVAIIGSALSAQGASAVTPDEMLRDPAQEARARNLSEQLRCVVCQNQTIDDSNAPLAHDLRVLLRERIAAGDTDQQALDFMVQRYSKFVLMKPPFEVGTLLLWFGPFITLGLALWGFFAFIRPRAHSTATTPAGLTEAEQKQLDELLKEGRAQ